MDTAAKVLIDDAARVRRFASWATTPALEAEPLKLAAELEASLAERGLPTPSQPGDRTKMSYNCFIHGRIR